MVLNVTRLSLLILLLVIPPATAGPKENRPRKAAATQAQAVMGASVFAVCPGTKLKKLDTELHLVIEKPPRNATTLDLFFSGTFRPEVVDPNQDIFKKKFKGTFSADFECGDGSTVKVGKTTNSSLGDDDKHHIIFPVELDLDTCPTPVVAWATFDAKGGSVNKNLTGDPVPLNFSFCALAADESVNIIPSSFSCSIGHPLADQC